MDFTRKQMEGAIKRGESVSYLGRIITRIEDLPEDSELIGSAGQKRAKAKRLRDESNAAIAEAKQLEADADALDKAESERASAEAKAAKRPAAQPPADAPRVVPGQVHPTSGVAAAPAKTAETPAKK